MRIRIIFLSTFFLIASVSFAQKTITAQEVIQKGQLEGSWVPMSALQSNYVVMQLWQFDGIYLMVYRDYNKDFEITRMHKVTLEKTSKGKFINSREFNQKGAQLKYLMIGNELSMYVNGKKMEQVFFKEYRPDNATIITIDH